MAQYTFSGGIHPYDGKELSKDKPIRDVLPKGLLVYPLSQHIGAPAKPVVKVGDHVKTGQMIAEAGGFVSANIFATVSGTVKSIERHRVPVGDMVQSIIVENDGLYEEVEYTPAKPLEQQSREEIIAAVKDAGIVGMGGAGFPTHVKLSPKDPSKIDHVIANCAECEPYLTSDYRRMMENPDLLIGGMKCVLKLFENAKGIIAIEDNKPDAIELLTRLTKDEPRIEVYALQTKYPQGSERHIIYACTKRAINSKMLPADAGCIVDNCDTVLFAVKPIFFGKMFESIKDSVRKDQLFISIVASTSIAELEEYLGKDARIVRVMPNTPAMVGEGMASLSPNANATEEDVEKAKAIFNACGKCEVMEERLIPAVTALSGSSPAYVFMFIEALADAGVQAGMFREPAYKFAAQAVKGSAEMVLETGLHPGILKDMVCSPGGTTIEAVRVLEKNGFRSAVIEATAACIEKSRNM